MKNLLKKSFFTLAVLCIGYGAFAQDQTVTISTAHTYSVTAVPGITYTWATTGGTSTNLLTQNTNSMTLTWDATGTYDVTVFGTDGNGCITETRTSTILVVGEASVMFANAAANDPVVTCSPLLGGAITASNFDVEFTDGVAPFSLTYEITAIDGSTSTQTVSIGNAGDPSPVTGVLSINDWENTTGGDQIVSIRLVSATTADSGVVVVNTDVADNTRSVTVHSKPTISGTITLN